MISASPNDMDQIQWARTNPFESDAPTPSRPTFALDIPTHSQTRLSFPKLSIPLRSPSSSTCTDSELVQTDSGCGSGTLDDQNPCSPSLISYIFARKASLGGSSSSNGGNETPITPQLLASGQQSSFIGSCSRPILRRPQSSSLNCSTSDDGSGYSRADKKMIPELNNLHSSLHGGFNGLGLSIDEPTSPSSRVEKRQSCLTFAVKSPPSRQATSLVSPSSIRSAGILREEDTKMSNRDNEEDFEEDDDEESDDGYEEDEEGGFTSDEDLTSPFTRGGMPTSSGSSFISSRPYTPNTFSPNFPPISIPLSASTSDEGIMARAVDDESRQTSPSRGRGRKISIATTKCAEKCSRHRSPPPTSHLPLSTESECPPAARSPSALGLCRRRETTTTTTTTSTTHCKSDSGHSPGIIRTRSMGPSLPCKSILRMSGVGPSVGSVGERGASTSGIRRASMSAVGALES